MEFDLELYREFVEIEPGISLSYIDVAPERPIRTFLFIHGFGGNAKQWQYQINSFAQQNHVIAVDLRGHGSSSRSSTISYAMENLISDILIVLEKANVHTKIVLVSHSFGVAVATEMASRYPQRISNLILIAGAGEYNIRLPYKVAFRFPVQFLRTVQDLVNNFIDASLVSLKKLYFQTVRNWQGWDKFPTIELPTLIILGNKDRVLPQEAYQRVVDLIPKQNSEVLNVNVSAHLVMLERRDAVNRAISRFVSTSFNDEQTPIWRSRLDIGNRGSLLRERPWLAYYDSNVPATIHVPDQPLTRLLKRSARRFPRRLAVIEQGKKLDYSTLYDEVLRFANAFYKLDVPIKSRVMVILPNRIQLAVTYYGVLEAGGVISVSNPFADEDELLRQLSLIDASVLITWKENPLIARLPSDSGLKYVILTDKNDYSPWFEKLLIQLKGEQEEVVNLSGLQTFNWSSFIENGSIESLNVEISPHDVAVIQFTGGISGPPKGVALSHKNLLANVLQMRAWFHKAHDGQEVAISLLPISHIYGMTAALNFPISQGATCILVTDLKIDDIVRLIRKYEPTYFPAVPSLLMTIKDYPQIRDYNVGGVRTFLSSQSPLPIEVEEAFEKVTKSQLVEAYGLTEASALTHISPINKRDKIGSIGLPLPSTEARIVDFESKRVLLPGQVGELWVRGPQVMQGYWQDQEATEAVVDDLGWLCTGDIARMDSDGFFQIISKSHEHWHLPTEAENSFYPRDIEEIIYELPSVEEVVVVILAGRPLAFVKVKEKSDITPKYILAYCRRRLPSEMVPWRVIFAGDFPRNLIGRVRRKELVERFQQAANDDA